MKIGGFRTLFYLILFLPFALSDKKDYTLKECSEKANSIRLGPTTGTITGVNLGNGSRKNCLWYVYSPTLEAMTIYMDAMEFDCTKGSITVRFLSLTNPKPTPEDLCKWKGKRGFLGLGLRFEIMVNNTGGASGDSLVRFRYYTCGGRLSAYYNSKGTIELPEVTEAYLNRIRECSWTIKEIGNANPVVKLESIDIEVGSGCSRDVLTITTKERTVRFCEEDDLKKTLTVTGDSIKITFKAYNKSSRRRKFKFRYHACLFKQKIPPAAQNVSVTTVDYPSPVPPTSKCLWLFETDVLYSLYFYIVDLELQNPSDCTSGSLTLKNNEQKLCKTVKQPLAWIKLDSRAELDFRTGQRNSAGKFKILVSSIKLRKKIEVRMTGKNVTTTFIKPPKFPGPLPMGLSLTWQSRNRGPTAIFLESYRFSPSTCAEGSMTVGPKRVNPKTWPRLIKVCADSKQKLGYLGTAYWFQVVLNAKNVSVADFSLRLDHSDGMWSTWKGGKCSVVCGSGKVIYKQLCNSPPPTVKDKGCFFEDGRTRGFVKEKSYGCIGGYCRMTNEETWFSVSFKLLFSAHLSTKQFNEVVGPAIKQWAAQGVNRFCNKNAERCCGDASGWKKRDTALKYTFLNADSVRFTKDSPTIEGPSAKVSFYAVPEKDNELCSGRKAVVSTRRKRATPTSPPAPAPTDGAMPKEVLFAALKDIDDSEIIDSVTKALHDGNLTVTVNVSKAMSEVQSVGLKKKNGGSSGLSYFYKIGLPIMLVLLICKLIYFICKCTTICSASKEAEAQEEQAGGDASIPLAPKGEEAEQQAKDPVA